MLLLITVNLLASEIILKSICIICKAVKNMCQDIFPICFIISDTSLIYFYFFYSYIVKMSRLLRK